MVWYVCAYAWNGVLCVVCVYIYVVYVCGTGCAHMCGRYSRHSPGYHRVNVGDVFVGEMAEQPLVIRVALLTCYPCCMSGSVLNKTRVNWLRLHSCSTTAMA